jgi:hypothetical protein
LAKSAAPRHLFTAGAEKDDVAISASGQQPLSVWVTGFGDGLKERHKQFGLRVVQVEYLDGDNIIGQLAGDPNKAWQFDAFLNRATALSRGIHKVRARVKLLAADEPTVKPRTDKGTLPRRTETVLSPEMPVTIRDVFAPWMQEAARVSRANLIIFKKTKVTASTASKVAKKACDGSETTQWVCAASDQDPTIEIDLGRSVSAKSLMISQAGSRAIDIGLYDCIKVIEVRINDGKPMRLEVDSDQLAITTMPFSKSRKVRRLQIRIVERQQGRKAGQAGFTEIALGK